MEFNYWNVVLGKEKLKVGTLLLTYNNALYQFTRSVGKAPMKIYGINVLEDNSKEEKIMNLMIKEIFKNEDQYYKYYDKELQLEIRALEYNLGNKIVEEMECEQIFLKSNKADKLSDNFNSGYYNVFKHKKNKYIVLGKRRIMKI